MINSPSYQINDFNFINKEWKNKSPVVIVPTKYFITPTYKFRDWGVNLVIWANHNLRASVKAM